VLGCACQLFVGVQPSLAGGAVKVGGIFLNRPGRHLRTVCVVDIDFIRTANHKI
jgi:hypothetical protein